MNQITVVIPTFNRSRLVQRAIESVLSQTRPANQIVVVDDGSKDETGKACERFAGLIEYVYQPNGGVSSARNHGIKLARFPWTAFLDSDDYWTPTHLEKISDAIRETDGRARFYFSDMRTPGDEGDSSLWTKIGFQFTESFVLKQDATDWMLSKRQPTPIPCSVFNTDILREHGSFDARYRVMEDTELFCRLGIGAPVCAVNTVGGVETADDQRTNRLTGMVHSRSLTYWEHDRRLWHEVAERFPKLKRPHKRVIEFSLGSAYWRLARLHWQSHAYLAGTKSFFYSVKVCPGFLVQLVRYRRDSRRDTSLYPICRATDEVIFLPENAPPKTYGQIMKSSVLIGGSSALNVGFRIARAKVMAMLLGPSGIGLLGLYGSVSDVTRSIAGVGIKDAGVRQIAVAAGTGDGQRIARTTATLRRTSICCGVLGAIILLTFPKVIARLALGSEQRAGSVQLLSLVVFLSIISDGQGAVIQGMRKITDMARMSVLGAFYGTLFSISVVYIFYRFGKAEDGVVPSLICVAAMSIVTSWWYSRKISTERAMMSVKEVVEEASGLLKMGVVFMSTGLVTLGSGFAARVIVLHLTDLQSAGYYHSAWAIGSLYIGFILEAMGADFYPRLTAVADDNKECNRLVNEQTEVGLLLGAPGMLGTLVFAHLIIQLFYSSKFGAAVEILRWISLGMLLRAVSWPIGFMLLAKSERSIFFVTELLKNLIFIGLIWVGVSFWGLRGAGMAFLGMYAIYSVGIYFVARWVSGFSWSEANVRLMILFGVVATFVFANDYFLPYWIQAGTDAVCVLLTSIYSLRKLSTLVPIGQLPSPVQKIMRLFRLTPT